MQRETLSTTLGKLVGKFVEVNIQGAVHIPYFINNFELVEDEKTICFGENECECFPFEIYKETITDIHVLQDDFETVIVKIKIQDAGFVTILHISSDLEVINNG